MPGNLRARPGQTALALALLVVPALEPMAPIGVAGWLFEAMELVGALLLGAAAAGLLR